MNGSNGRGWKKSKSNKKVLENLIQLENVSAWENMWRYYRRAEKN
jgi:hypothetical protein